MNQAQMPQIPAGQRDPDALVRLGAWLFRRRTWLPVPLAAALLLIPSTAAQQATLWAGLGLVLTGEAIRIWGVRHIGVVSRTRVDRSGPLVASGPFRYVRNPLYLGNLALWTGFTIAAGLSWLAPFVLLLFALEYHAIVRWEETLLESRLGRGYRDYATTVPRWIPAPARRSQSSGAPFSWRETFFSERGTLIGIALGIVLVWLKALG